MNKKVRPKINNLVVSLERGKESKRCIKQHMATNNSHQSSPHSSSILDLIANKIVTLKSPPSQSYKHYTTWNLQTIYKTPLIKSWFVGIVFQQVICQPFSWLLRLGLAQVCKGLNEYRLHGLLHEDPRFLVGGDGVN